MKAGVAHKHILSTGKVQDQDGMNLGELWWLVRRCFTIWHLSLTCLLTMFAGDKKQGKVMITMDGRSQIHRGLHRAGAMVKLKMKFNRKNQLFT